MDTVERDGNQSVLVIRLTDDVLALLFLEQPHVIYLGDFRLHIHHEKGILVPHSSFS